MTASSRDSSQAVIHEAFAGFCAGVVGTILGFPLDTIKTRMQTTHVGAMDAIKIIQNQHGLRGYYRGVGSPLVSLTILNTLNFSSYGYFCRMFGAASSPMNGFEWKYGVAAACVGPLASSISTPFELVKTKLQLAKKSSIAGEEKVIGGSVRMASTIIRTNGLKALYQGHAVNTLREMVFLSTYFLTYEHMKVNLIQSLSLSSSLATAISGGIAGALGWFISFPLDNIKSNIQGSPLSSGESVVVRKSAMEIGKEILQRNGIVGLYSGVGPSIARAFIVSASRFSAYEFALTIVE
jgi:solute carrier family 25 carnitine/acylcarnitine transporter 20/29